MLKTDKIYKKRFMQTFNQYLQSYFIIASTLVCDMFMWWTTEQQSKWKQAR